jgi:hypothetical protein
MITCVCLLGSKYSSCLVSTLLSALLIHIWLSFFSSCASHLLKLSITESLFFVNMYLVIYV